MPSRLEVALVTVRLGSFVCIVGANRCSRRRSGGGQRAERRLQPRPYRSVERARSPYDFSSFAKGDPPMTPWGEEQFKAAKPSQGPREHTISQTNDMVYKCFPPGMPYIYLQVFPFQIVQTPTEVIELFEYDHFVRHILHQRPQAPCRPDADVRRRLHRPLGRRHAGRRYRRPERENLAGSCGPSRKRSNAHHRAHPPRGREDLADRFYV